METIINSASEVLTKQKSVKKTVITTIELLISVLLVAIAVLFIPNKASAIYMLLITFGALGIIIFSIRLFASNKHIVYKPTGSRVVDYSLFFATEEINRLTDAVRAGDVSIMPKVSGENNSGVRLDILLSEDDKFAACQVFKYIPYSYEATSDVFHIADEKLSTFCRRIKELGAK